jgi:hypothetical protein
MENNNRCFDSFNTVLSASERATSKRNLTIYKEMYNNAIQLNTINPIKKNGFTYNKNSSLQPICDLSSGHVNSAISYELRSDIKQGSNQVYNQSTSTPKYESWCGNLYEVNYVKHGIAQVLEVSGNNVVIDPSYVLFYNECVFNYDGNNKPEPWLNAVDLSFQQTYFAKSANNRGCS